MSLRDQLNAAPAPDARRDRVRPPKGCEDGVRYQAGLPSEVGLSLPTIPPDEVAWRQAIKDVLGLTIPEDRQVVLKSTRYWGPQENLNIYCRYDIVDRGPAAADVDAVGILKALRPRKQVKTAFTGDTTLCLSWNDWQTGKLAGGGTPALAERLDASFDAAAQRARELRKIGRDLGRLVVLGGGDMNEGCSIFPNQPFEIDSDRRTQNRNTTAFILEGLDRLAPSYDDVTVLVVGGNHGENRIGGNRTTRHDNDDCAVFENAAAAASRDPRLQHVKFVIAQDEPAKTLDVNGWVLGTTHGNVFGKSGGTSEQKAYRWFCQQAAGRQPAGDCDVFVSHHWHHYASRDWGACLWVQTPAMDGGSPFFTDFSGQSAEPGMLSWVMSPEKRFVDAQIL